MDHAEQLPQWDDYLATLAGAGELLKLLADPADAQMQQEAYRLMCLSLGQGYLSTFSSPDCPDFIPVVNSVFNASSTNPDFIYYQSYIDDSGTYRICGNRGDALFVHCDMAAGGLGPLDEPGPSTGNFDLDTLAIAEDGAFELVLSAEKPAGYTGNWVQLPPGTRVLVIRQAAYDWGSGRDGRFAIERLDRPLAPKRLDAAEISRRLGRLMQHPKRYAGMWMGHVKRQREAGLVNRFELDDWAGKGGVTGQYYYQCLFRLEPGSALLLETELPEHCLYWNVQLSDPLWNSLDWLNHQCSLNGGQAHIDTDGKFRAVIALQDPGVPNWLDPAGYAEGALMLRWTRSSSGPAPALRQVPLAQLPEFLPEDTPVVTHEERQAALRTRRRGAQLRRRW